MEPVKKGDWVKFLVGEHAGQVFPVLGVRSDPSDLSGEIAKATAGFIGSDYIEIHVDCCQRLSEGFWYTFTPDWFEVVK